jgi:hypothetical protein
VGGGIGVWGKRDDVGGGGGGGRLRKRETGRSLYEKKITRKLGAAGRR